MITKLHLFEAINQTLMPEKDDYVICDVVDPSIPDTTNVIGKIISISDSGIEPVFKVKFDEWEEDRNTWPVLEPEIKMWCKNRKELKKILTQRRFDL